MDSNGVNGNETTGHGSFAISKETCYTKCATILGGAWKQIDLEEFHCEEMSGGLSNILYRCALPAKAKTVGNEPREVVVRFFGKILRENPYRLMFDSVVFALLSERKVGPQLFGIFDEGRIEEFIPSGPLLVDELGIPAVSKQVAEMMAEFHKTPKMPFEKEPRVFDTMHKWLATIKKERHEMPVLPPQVGSDPLPTSNHATSNGAHVYVCDADASECDSHEQQATTAGAEAGGGWGGDAATAAFRLEYELKWLQRNVEGHKAGFPVVFCHNDLQENNILKQKDEKHKDGFRLQPIDFEHCSYNYRAFDFGNHFCEWTYNNVFEEKPYYSHPPGKYPTREERKAFFTTYLSAQSKSAVELTDEQQNVLELEAAYGALMSHIYWTLWSIVQHKLSNIPFGYLSYASDRMDDYVRMKRYALALEAGDWNANYVDD